VQVLGGVALHRGDVAEMKTGEGKTLASTMPVYLNALSGEGAHVVTVNPFLAARDADWMGQVYRFLGLSTGLVYSRQPKDEKRAAYAADVTYGTNNEFGFDFLRDHMVLSPEDKVQRGHHYCIVDEVDSILIDEARTPLIISGPADQATEWYEVFARRVAPRLTRGTHYEVEEDKRTVSVTEEGVERVEQILGVGNLYESVNTPLIHHLQNSLRAKELYRRDQEYMVSDGEVLIVDEFTGRTLPGRRYSEGLHQSIEAKEGVAIQNENQTLATITLQNYFRTYDKLAGMTGTAKTEEGEFAHTYEVGVSVIPTNEPVIRDDTADQIYKTEQAKFNACVEDIAERNERGQPVLVGTVSIEKSEKISEMLTRRGVPHEVLNAKNHFKEAEIIAQAGQPGSVTVATNMAGRGVDIMLGGNPEGLAEAEARKQVDADADPEEFNRLYTEALERFTAQVKAEGDKVRERGGLYVLATERHEARRIDNQLRGRSGRQGDPGESRFYLSLEDDLMRLFNSSAVESIMSKFNLPEDVPIEHKMVSRAVARAQNQVESRNFEIRKNVLKYDDVMNKQRMVIYEQRNVVLWGADEEVGQYAEDFIDETVRGLAATYAPEGVYPEEWDLESLWTELGQLYSVGVDRETLDLEAYGSHEALAELLVNDAMDRYEERETEVGAAVQRQVERQVILSVVDRLWREHLYEMDHLREGIGLRAVGQRDPLVEYQREAYDAFNAMMARIKQESVGYFYNLPVTVQEVDEAGRPVDEAGQPVGEAEQAVDAGEAADESQLPPDPETAGAVAAPGGDGDAAASTSAQQDTEAGSQFDRARLAYTSATAAGDDAPEQSAASYSISGMTETSHNSDAPGQQTDAGSGQAVSTKVGRNASCPCGSGAKYKKCHGA
jgi:preprotein translocase subunit SecA